MPHCLARIQSSVSQPDAFSPHEWALTGQGAGLRARASRPLRCHGSAETEGEAGVGSVYHYGEPVPCPPGRVCLKAERTGIPEESRISKRARESVALLLIREFAFIMLLVVVNRV